MDRGTHLPGNVDRVKFRIKVPIPFIVDMWLRI